MDKTDLLHKKRVLNLILARDDSTLITLQSGGVSVELELGLLRRGISAAVALDIAPKLEKESEPQAVPENQAARGAPRGTVLTTRHTRAHLQKTEVG